MKRKIRYGYSNYTDAALLIEANQIHGKMTIDPALGYFPNAQGELMLLGAAIIAFAASRGIEKTKYNLAIRKVDRQKLVDILVKIALKISEKAEGDEVMLTSSGYTLVKLWTRRMDMPLGAPDNVKVTHAGLTGQAKLRCKPVPYALNYEVEYCLDLELEIWSRLPPVSNSQKIIIAGLQRGKEYWFRVRAIGPAGPGDWSNIYMLLIL